MHTKGGWKSGIFGVGSFSWRSLWRVALCLFVLGGWIVSALWLQRMEFRARLPAGWQGLWDGDHRPLLGPLIAAFHELNGSIQIEEIDGNPAYFFRKGSRLPIGHFNFKDANATTVAAWVRLKDPLPATRSFSLAGVAGPSFWGLGAWEGRPATWHMVLNTNLPPPHKQQIVPHRLMAQEFWPANEWVHLALVTYPESSEFYLNGRLVDRTDFHTMYEDSITVFLGHVLRGATDPLPETGADSLQGPPDFWLDDFVVYWRPLSAMDVANMARAGRGALRQVPEWRERQEWMGHSPSVLVLSTGVLLLGLAAYKRSWGTTLLGLGKELRQPAYAPVWLVLVFGSFLTVLLATRIHKDARESDEARLAEFGDRLNHATEGSMERVADLLLRARDFIRSNPEFTQEEWESWCEENDVHRDYVGLEMAWAPKVDSKDLEVWLEQQTPSQREWYRTQLGDELDAPGFHLPVRNTFGKLRSAIGWDWLGTRTQGEISRQKARELVLERHTITPSLGVPIRPPAPRMRPQVGLHLFLPVYKTSRPPEERREQDLMGVVYASLDFPLQVAEHWRGQAPIFGARFYTDSSLHPETCLVDTSELYINTRKPYRGSLEQLIRIRVYGWRFHVKIWTTDLFKAQSFRRLGLYVAVGGTGFTLMAAILLGIQIHARQVQATVHQALQTTTDRLRSAQEERRQLSRDLHDGAIQSLYGIQLELSQSGNGSTDLAFQRGNSVDTSNTFHPVQDLDLRIDAIISELRRFLLTDEVEAALERQVHLHEVLDTFVTRLSRACRARIRFEANPEAARALTTDQSLQLAFIAHEALSNSVRHAQAEEILVTLEQAENERVRLRIQDRGCGYRLDGIHPGIGLRSIRQRADQIRADLQLDSVLGHGTTVTVELATSRTRLPSELATSVSA